MNRNPLFFMAGSTRLELATSYVTGRRSNRLSYDPIKLVIYTIFTFRSQPFFIKKTFYQSIVSATFAP